MRRSVFHSVSYFITQSVISQIPSGIYLIEKTSLVFQTKEAFFIGAPDRIWFSAIGVVAACAPRCAARLFAKAGREIDSPRRARRR